MTSLVTSSNDVTSDVGYRPEAQDDVGVRHGQTSRCAGPSPLALVAGCGEVGAGLLGQRGVELDSGHGVIAEPGGQQRGVIASAGPDLQDPLAVVEV